MDAQDQTPLLTMRAWTHTIRGAPLKVLSLSGNTARPSVASLTQVLVRVQYAALNPAGSVMMQLCPSFLRTKPCIPELDFAGQIVQADETIVESRGLKPGVRVFGSIPVPEHLKGQGALSEYVAVEAAFIAEAPKGIELQEAAGLPVAGVQLSLCLRERGWKEGRKSLSMAPEEELGPW